VRSFIIFFAFLGSGSTSNISFVGDHSDSASLYQLVCYTLGVAVSPLGAGSVSTTPAPNCNGGTQYTSGTVVQLRATANTSYRFDNWSRDIVGSSNPIAVMMDANKMVTAGFSTKIFDNGVWWIEKVGRYSLQQEMTVAVDGVDKGNTFIVRFGHLKVIGSYAETAVIYNDGFVRLTPLGLPYGTSFILGPAHWDSTDRYFHNLQISRIDIDTSSAKPSGPQYITITARDYNASFWPSYHFDITHQIIFNDPSSTSARMAVTQTYTAAANFNISASRQSNREGFKWAQLSSMYIDGTYHDSDSARYANSANVEQLVNFAGVTCSNFIFNSPSSLSPLNPWVQARHGDDAGWQGNTPNTVIRLINPSLASQTTPRGYLTCSTNPNDDNMGLWLNNDTATSFSSGQSNTVSYILISQDNPLLPPKLYFPNNAHPPHGLRPLFDWESVIGATPYRLQIAADRNFSALVYEAIVSSSAHLITTDLPRNTTLYWRVQADGPGGPSDWSAVQSFDTPNPPSKPGLSPVIVNGLTPTLDWSDSTPAPAYYVVQVATDADFKNVLGRGQGGPTRVSIYTSEIALTPNTTYYWRVQAFGNPTPLGQMQLSEWSNTSVFTTPCTKVSVAEQVGQWTEIEPPYPSLPVMYGLNFSPYVDGQDPNLGSFIPETQLRARMEIIAPYVQWIRTFGMNSGLEVAGRVAHDLGRQAALGAWLSRNLAANEQEIFKLITTAKNGEVDMAIVGSETLHRCDLTENQLISYINRVKTELQSAGVNIPVVTADVYSEFLIHPRVIAAIDAVFVNFYPYWGGINISNAVDTIDGWHQQLVAAANGKPVTVSETGWPSCGNTVGGAVPSPSNQARYFYNFKKWADDNNVQYFYFEAFDESWKAKYEGPQGACWGLWDKTGVLKPAFNGP
jgi:exo-beta-1,3-glucanase (GH17 family)